MKFYAEIKDEAEFSNDIPVAGSSILFSRVQ